MAKQKPPLLFGDWIRSECLDGDTLCEDCLADIIEMIRTAEEAALERAAELFDSDAAEGEDLIRHRDPDFDKEEIGHYRNVVMSARRDAERIRALKEKP